MANVNDECEREGPYDDVPPIKDPNEERYCMDCESVIYRGLICPACDAHRHPLRNHGCECLNPEKHFSELQKRVKCGIKTCDVDGCYEKSMGDAETCLAHC
jgi:hypothetical protein